MRRPEINFSKWKFSVDLLETKKIQNQEGMPAYGCVCKNCEAWRKYYKDTLTENLLMHLRRIGVDLDHPTECYGQQDHSGRYSRRVIFHIVGIIRSGPDSKVYNEDIGNYVMNYVPIRKDPWLSITVLPSRESYEVCPKRINGTDDGIVCIDIRLDLLCRGDEKYLTKPVRGE